MSWKHWDDDDFYPYPPSHPRQVKGGIKAQSKKGGFGETWWAKRWITVLESFQLGSRLTRGRSYARSGQVVSLEIEKGMVDAKVQGSRPSPYHVTVRLKPLSADEWKRVLNTFRAQAVFLAKLLAGEMPHEVENVFKDAGVALFPQTNQDLKTDCSCPDWSNPCKHVAAVYYLIGEEFDRDPFLLFKLRGMTREELLAQLGTAAKSRKQAPAPAEKPEPLEAGEAFWKAGPIAPEIYPDASPPVVTAAILKRLGRFPLWRGEETPLEALEDDYDVASRSGVDIVTGTPDGSDEK